MWTVLETKSTIKQIHKAPNEIRALYDAWKTIVRLGGPEALRNIKGYHDEALQGTRKGQRSSRLGLKWRVVYEVEREEVLAIVLEVSAHKY